MIQAAKQLGDNIYYLDEQGQASLEISNELADHIWKYFYEPYIKGHYVKSGRFSSDDARTGSVLAYTGSTAGAGYFPQEITINDNEIFQIEPLVLPYPYFREGEPYAVQQGAGMCISRSEPKRELAAYQFLKWFTLSEQNIDFAVSTGYFPVRQNDLTIDKLLKAYDTANKDVSAIRSSIVATSKMFEEYTLYNNKPFNGSYELRNLLERHLFEKIVSDIELIQKRVELGEDREAVIDDLISKDNQDLWVKQLHEDAMAIFSKY
jgi:multiple sugar transport system substrate-binding protein